MWHLSPEALIDLAEGIQPERAFPHLATCSRCQQELAGLREVMLATAADAAVPEPSPLFWDHLAARVRTAVTSEPPAPLPNWRSGWLSWRSAALGGAVGLAFVAALAWHPGPRRGTEPAARAPVVTRASEAFAFVADLAESLDWETAAEVGLTTRLGIVDGALTELSSDERLELERLLNEALSKPGAKGQS